MTRIRALFARHPGRHVRRGLRPLPRPLAPLFAAPVPAELVLKLMERSAWTPQ